MYNGIIFDLDGVICFTDQYHYQAWKQLADRLDIYFDQEINNKLRGISRMESLDIILEGSKKEYSMAERMIFAEEKNRMYQDLLKNMSPKDLSEEVSNTLKELRKKGYKLAIGSSSKNTKLILKRLGLEGYFDAISDGTNIMNSKPDPEVFLKAASFIKESPQKCLVVEDAESGIEAACRGNFHSAGIAEACKHPGVTYTLKSVGDLLTIL